MKGRAMAIDEAVLSEIIAVFKAEAPSYSDDLAMRCPHLFAEWEGGGHAYAEGERVNHGRKLYACLQAHSSQADWSPNTAHSLWAPVLAVGGDDGQAPEWVQPDSTNPYGIGDRVSHNGKVWESLVANNVWEPGAMGTESLWRAVE